MADTQRGVRVVIYVFSMLVLSVKCGTRLNDEAKLANSSSIEMGDKLTVESNRSVPCQFSLAEPNVIDVINGYFDGGMKLLRYNIHIDGNTETNFNSTNGSLYQPTSWILTNSPAGSSLLLLKDYFNEMSLYTLGYGTETVNVNLNQTPPDCLARNVYTAQQFEELLREGVLKSFGDSEFKLSSGIRACNLHVENTTDNIGRFVYRCCEESLNGSVNCDDVTETTWLTLLFNAIHFLQLTVILFSPLLIPQTAYRLSSSFIDYVYKPQHKPLTFNVMRLNPASNTAGEGFVEVRKHWFTTMEEFKRRAWEMVPCKKYTMSVGEVKLRVKASKIIPEGYVPVGLFAFLRKFFFRCGLRKDIPATTRCCDANMFKWCPCKIKVPWYRCGIYLGSAILPFIIMLPWLVRVWFYYAVEDISIATKRKAMLSRQLVLTSTGSLTTDLSPLSTVFVITYILVPAEAVLYTLVPRNVKRKLKFTIKQCFRDMRATGVSTVCAKFTEYLCLPFIYFGVIGCIFLPLLLCTFFPILLIIFTAMAIPIFNVSIRMIVNCFYYIMKVVYPYPLIVLKPEDENSCLAKLSRTIYGIFGKVLVDDVERVPKRKNKLIYAISLASCFVTIWLLLLIVAECISFYVECSVYTLTGIILNSRHVMKHLSLLLVIGYYGYDCFSSVYTIYVTFNRTINTAIQKAVGDDVKPIAEMSALEQPNSAFTVNRTDTKLFLTASSYGFLKCSINSLLLFLTHEDVPLIPKKFLMHIAKKSHFACPNKPHVLYLRALLDFLSILFFLMFVILVIFAFGQANNVSSANQSLAALGGSFLPLVFRKFLFKSHGGPVLDTSNIAWTTTFDAAVKDCTCLWDVEDLIVKSCEETAVTDKVVADVTNDTTGDITGLIEDDEADIRLLKALEPSSDGVDLKVKLEASGHGSVNMKLFVREKMDDSLDTLSRIEHIEDTPV